MVICRCGYNTFILIYLNNYLKYFNTDAGDYYMERQLYLINEFYLSFNKEYIDRKS